MFVKKRSYLISIITAVLLTITACVGNQLKDNKVVMLTYLYGQFKLAPGASVVKPDGVEFYNEDGPVNPADIEANRWTIVKLVNKDGGWFSILTPNGTVTRVRLVKPGEKLCPDWVGKGLFDSCEVFEFQVP